jgi:hypothetical protein
VRDNEADIASEKDGRARNKADKVLLFAKAITPEAGGIETYSEQVALAFAERGFEVTVITSFRGAPGVSHRKSIVMVNVGHGNQRKVAAGMLKAAIHYRKRAGEPALIHATTWRVAVPALAVFPRTRLIVTVHGREVTEMSRWLAIPMRLVFGRATKALVISHTTLAAVVQRIPSIRLKSIVSWNGITSPSDRDYENAIRMRGAGQRQILFGDGTAHAQSAAGGR